MKKEDLLKQIAETGYNVGLGAKKHFATYDIVCKAPNWISFLSIGVGVFALIIDVLATKHMSAILIVLGISSFFINFYGEKINIYDEKGKELTKLFNSLKLLYFSVSNSKVTSLDEFIDNLKGIESKYYALSISKQIFLSDWYAHYKFFWQHQIDWIDEQKHFKFWRDKVPLSFTLFLVVFVIVLICGGVYWEKLMKYI